MSLQQKIRPYINHIFQLTNTGGYALPPHLLVLEVSNKCNLCEGNPKCVEICPKNALVLTQYDKLSITKKREKAESYIEYQKGVEWKMKKQRVKGVVRNIDRYDAFVSSLKPTELINGYPWRLLSIEYATAKVLWGAMKVRRRILRSKMQSAEGIFPVYW